MSANKFLMGFLAFAMLAFSFAMIAPSASASDGTVSLTGGSLSIAAVADFSYGTTALTGTSQALTSSFVVDVTDATGSAAGWNLTAQIGVMTATGSKTIAASNHTISGVTRASGTGTAPTNGSTYPMQIPSSTAKIYSAAATSGMGQSSLSFATGLAIPASTLAGNYTATLTVSIVSGP